MSVTLCLETLDQTVYEEMLSHTALGVDELAAKLDVEPDRIRDCLDRLFALQLVQASFEAPSRFTVVDPVLGMKRLLEQQHEELVRSHRQAAGSQQALIRILAGAGGGAQQADGVERLAGLDSVQGRLERLALEAGDEILTFMPGGPQSPASLEAAVRNDALVLQRGVAIRTIGLDSVRGDAATLRYTRALVGQGGEFRTAAALPTRMVVVDRTYALVPIDPADSRKGALFLSAPGMIAPLLALFEREWGAAVPLGSDPSDASYVPSEQERSLLALLAQGHTDESAAGQLHISARTARRIMAALIERLGARSRFEAGLRAARLGWV
ncbi:helix-turn-helix transcriptional regulator [Streptomyces kaniharaensis]|uniref:Helix-turn-helix transcriptional regulator n=1 Tax=Streptomyces kaniharaensis TaxID=212423 RepID=A0A6N7KVX0_9ACTN|nr:helix-turn-helix transcriptional regulator [Streptomyces kaniharaensis]MQS15786.1 helix-turn-helix transcriptional regulator [Streptomyces kaniharaensis]